MEIKASKINLSSAHKLKKEYTKRESLKVWTKTNNNRQRGKKILAKLDQIELSDDAKQKLNRSQESEKGKGIKEIVFELTEEDKLKIELLKEFLEKVQGKKIEVDIAEKIVIKADKIVIKANKAAKEEEKNWAVEYNYQETYTEEESMAFKAKGIVTTKDGRGIKFSLDLKLNRKYSRQENIHLVAGNKKLIDPLIINLNDDSVELNSKEIEFDLNSDGEKERIATLKPGSAFLALDKNEDGIINNGGELFGPKTGNGFAELAQYDKDSNNWIDEGDEVFKQLKLWSGSAEEGELSNLKKAGVGAIYLGAVDSFFTLKDANNQTQGEIDRSSVYLTESGEVKTVQKINLKA